MTSLTDRIVSHLSEDIRSGAFRPGEKLPPETGLIQRFGVSRSVVREAVSRLQAAHLVQTRHGIGTFVRDNADIVPFPAVLPDLSNMDDVMAILEFRIDLETGAAALAALRRTETDLARIREALDRFEAEIRDGGIHVLAHDVEFHLSIAQASGNRYYRDVQNQMGRGISPRTRLGVAELAELDRMPHLQCVLNEHHAIYNAITRGDPEDARAAMRIHLSNSRERLKLANATGR